ncbi:MAG: hypothetical protein H7066_21065, partial [Cytophagaceae bacterium]|nr:hypothetical protein [Gemmatimonadaceae bacterium]
MAALAIVVGLLPASAVAAARSTISLQVRVTNQVGRPLANRSVIVSTMWSSKADWQQHGRAVSRKATTDALGNASIHIALTDVERAAARRNNDWVNLTVVTLDVNGNPEAFASSSRYLGSKPDQQAQRSDLPHQDRLDLTGSSRARSVAAPAPLASCTYYWEAYSYQDRYAQVGELHADYDFVDAMFTYGETADSNVDVMSHASGVDWYISGSFHVGNSRSASVGVDAPTNNYHWALRTEFTYVKMRLFKDCLGGPYHSFTGSEEVGVLEWAGGGMVNSNPVTQPARNPANSQTYGPGGFWSRSSSYLTRVSTGAGAFGLTFGIQSGASTEVKYYYKFGSRSTHYLYGNNAKPNTSSRVFQDT